MPIDAGPPPDLVPVHPLAVSPPEGTRALSANDLERLID